MDKPNGIIRLDNARLSNLEDDKDSWPDKGNLNIDGLTYGPFSSGVPADSESRLEWLNLRHSDDTSVQPYEQLVSVFRQMGLEDDARGIAIAKHKFIRKNLKGVSRLWSWILDITISYGYRPQNVIKYFILPILILGIVFFYTAFTRGYMIPTNGDISNSELALLISNGVFDPIAYSVDVFLPIVNLHQENAWRPNISQWQGQIVQYYMYFHILAGWVFTTLAVAAVTGLVRRD